MLLKWLCSWKLVSRNSVRRTQSWSPRFPMGLGLPFTHNRRWTKSLISQRKPEAHELKCGVALPDQLMTGRWVVVASEISADLRDQAYRFTQQHRWLQAFFLRRRATSAIRHRRTTPRQAGSASRGPAASSA